MFFLIFPFPQSPEIESRVSKGHPAGDICHQMLPYNVYTLIICLPLCLSCTQRISCLNCTPSALLIVFFFLVDFYKVYPSLRGFQGRSNSPKYGHDDLPVVECEDRSVPAGEWQPSSVPFVRPTQHHNVLRSYFMAEGLRYIYARQDLLFH